MIRNRQLIRSTTDIEGEPSGDAVWIAPVGRRAADEVALVSLVARRCVRDAVVAMGVPVGAAGADGEERGANGEERGANGEERGAGRGEAGGARGRRRVVGEVPDVDVVPAARSAVSGKEPVGPVAGVPGAGKVGPVGARLGSIDGGASGAGVRPGAAGGAASTSPVRRPSVARRSVEEVSSRRRASGRPVRAGGAPASVLAMAGLWRVRSDDVPRASTAAAAPELEPQRAPRGGGGPIGGGPAGGSSGGSSGGEDGTLLSERELKAIERDHADGLTSVQIVDIFTQRGIRFSEATFRKYVQQGLLPRSRRVGRKGKHQGSLGLYPATTVRRINAIKQLMAENYTIEDIQKRFLRFRDEVEGLERSLGVVFAGFEEEIRAPHFDTQAKRDLKRDVAEARKIADDLLRRLEHIERRVSEPHERPAGGGAPGGAEDLL